MVWRVFPREKDGAKVVLLPSSGRKIDQSLRELLADILNGLRRDRPIEEEGEEFEVGLHTVASEHGWRRFKAGLQCALEETMAST